jgi:hypothetical protein
MTAFDPRATSPVNESESKSEWNARISTNDGNR